MRESAAFTMCWWNLILTGCYRNLDWNLTLRVLSSFSAVSPSDIDAANGNSSVQEQGVNPALHTTQNAPEIEHYDQPAEENESDEQEETKQEQKHKVNQIQEEQDNNNKEVDAVQPQHQQEVVPDQEEAQSEGETSRDLAEPEDTEQVETFFSTMSHRYENATQEGHIL